MKLILLNLVLCGFMEIYRRRLEVPDISLDDVTGVGKDH